MKGRVAVQQLSAAPTREAAAALLDACGLPAADLTDEHMRHFFYAGPAGNPAGIVGVELCGPDALLRSLAVSAGARESGLGSALVAQVESYARSQGARAIYLLTTTAERFFARRGYVATSRADAPEAIRETREFAAICPASSAFMFKALSQ